MYSKWSYDDSKAKELFIEAAVSTITYLLIAIFLF